MQGLFQNFSKYFFENGEKNEKNWKKALDKRGRLCYNIKLHYNCRACVIRTYEKVFLPYKFNARGGRFKVPLPTGEGAQHGME